MRIRTARSRTLDDGIDEEDDSDSDEAEGFDIDRFRIVRRLGAGGMGIVFEAVDRETNAHVALKSLRLLSAEAVYRFKNEFRAIAYVSHPNLVRLGELFVEGGQWFFTMELVRGVHFNAHVRPSEYKNGKRIAQPQPKPISVSDAVTLENALQAESVEATPRPVAPTAGFDERRLRDALKQLAMGLSALHAAEKVHCDIKPSNILVTPEGRVVLLDFGLVTDVSQGERPEHLAGTISYMSPEQAGMRPLGPEADWYSVGVVLYQALTGRLPIMGKPEEVLARKQVQEPPAPRSILPGIPADLDQLCVDLLHIDPAERPTGPDILQRLDALQQSATSLRSSTFVGRQAEMDVMRRALESSRDKGAVAVFVCGESGVGKSALTRRFIDAVTAEVPSTLVLAGRCHERESVPYKAVDGVADALCRYLKKNAGADARIIPPSERGLLGQVFPVMRRIEVVARAPRPLLNQIDPQTMRRRAFAAFRMLLSKLAERHPLLVVIDDLQWADADSLALLSDIMREPGAPRMLFIGTMRTGTSDPRSISVMQDIATQVSGDVRSIEIGPLPANEARALATALLRGAGSQASRLADAIAAESQGHPLFIDELVRRASAGLEGGSMRLDEAIWARIAELRDHERELTKLVAIVGAPLRQEIVATASGLPLPLFDEGIAALRSANFVRTLGTRRTDTVEPYHDRVREAVVARLPEAERRRLHSRVAIALEATEDADPEALAMHWRGAGDPTRAAREAERAAMESLDKLAFDRAARLYELALELLPRPPHEAAPLYARLGEALASAGRGAEAARALLQAASLSPVAAIALDLRRHAAEQLLRSGHIDEAMETFGVVLEAIGMDMPKTTRAAVTSLVMRRAQVRLRGLHHKPRTEREIAPDVLARIDTCWAVATGLGLVDTVRGAYFQARALLLALDAGEAKRIARALAIEASYSSASGGHTQARTAELRDLATEIAKEAGEPYTLGWAVGAKGMTAALEGRWDVGHSACEEAEAIFQEHCRGVAWEVASMRWFSLWSQCYLGRIAELTQRIPERLNEAESRGDLYAAMCNASGLANMVWLVDDEPEEARRRLSKVMERWSLRNFHVEHWWEMLAKGQIDLYEGDGAGALARVQERWSALDGSLLLRVQLTLLEATHLRARASLMAATQKPGEAKSLLSQTEKDIHTIEKENMPWSNPLAALLRAGVAHVKGDANAAKGHLLRALGGLEAAHLGLYAMATRYRLGALLGGEAGQAHLATAETWFALQGVARPERLMHMLTPGLDG